MIKTETIYEYDKNGNLVKKTVKEYSTASHGCLNCPYTTTTLSTTLVDAGSTSAITAINKITG